MSALIRFGDGDAVRSLTLGTKAVADGPSADPRERETARLAAEVMRLTEALEESEERARAAASDAREEGRLVGLAEAEDCEAERLALLREALEEASDAFAIRLATLEGLAPQLARAALDKLFGSVEAWAPMIEAALGYQLALLRRASVVALHVSPHDFGDAAAIEKLGGALDSANLAVALDPDLPAGAARLMCKLGRIDVDVREQWATLAALLDAMASGEAE